MATTALHHQRPEEKETFGGWEMLGLKVSDCDAALGWGGKVRLSWKRRQTIDARTPEHRRTANLGSAFGHYHVSDDENHNCLPG